MSRSAAPIRTQPVPGWVAPDWDTVVREHSDRVYRLAFRLAGNRHDAEDITQETFVRVFRSLHTFRPGSLEAWLHRITTNVFLDSVRLRGGVRVEPLADHAEDLPNPPGYGDPETSYYQRNIDPAVQAAVDELPADFRLAVVLCDVEGMSYTEIGKVLGLKLGTVRSRIHRGRQALRQSLLRRSVWPEGPAACADVDQVPSAGST